MQFVRAVVANPNTKVEAHWYDTTQAEHLSLLAAAEAAGQVYMRPESARQEVQTWRCRPAGVPCGQAGEYNLLLDLRHGTAYVRFVAPDTVPTLF